VSDVFHPSLPGHPDRAAIDAHYQLPGSLLSFRLLGAREEEARHFADVLATCIVPRYALSFDGLTTKVNHHRTVSEYFTPDEEILRAGIDRVVRLGVGMEDADDIIACLNWSLWRHDAVSAGDVRRWQEAREGDLGIYRAPGNA
jgi:cystathionine beta-lyase/cystathionine gamma-synthase